MSSFADDSEGIPSSDNICALLKEHANEISLLKDLVEKIIPADRTDGIFCKYDNIFFLRYILSFGSASKAKEAVEYTLNFRKEPRWRKLIQQIKDDTYEENDFVKEMQKWQVASEMEGITVSGGFCVVIRGGLSDQATMIDRIPKEDMYTANMAYREMAFQKCDTVTRNTGQLAKQVLFFDMQGSKLSDMMDRRMSDMYADISKVSANVYPQLQEKMCLVNAPKWMSWVMAFFQRLLPTRTMEKFELFSSSSQMWESDWAKERLIKENAPAFMGGGKADDDLMPQLTGKLRSYAPSPEITISARSQEVVDISIPVAPAQIKFNLIVVARGINFSAEFIQGKGSGPDDCLVPKSTTEAPVVLRPVSKLKADEGAQIGSWHVDTPGLVRVTFDNGYSMLRSKTVKYSLEVHGIKEGPAAAAAAKWRETSSKEEESKE